MPYELQRFVSALLNAYVPVGDEFQQIGRVALQIALEAMWAADPKPDAPESIEACIEIAEAQAGRRLDYDARLLTVRLFDWSFLS